MNLPLRSLYQRRRYTSNHPLPLPTHPLWSVSFSANLALWEIYKTFRSNSNERYSRNGNFFDYSIQFWISTKEVVDASEYDFTCFSSADIIWTWRFCDQSDYWNTADALEPVGAGELINGCLEDRSSCELFCSNQILASRPSRKQMGRRGLGL